MFSLAVTCVNPDARMLIDDLHQLRTEALATFTSPPDPRRKHASNTSAPTAARPCSTRSAKPPEIKPQAGKLASRQKRTRSRLRKAKSEKAPPRTVSTFDIGESTPQKPPQLGRTPSHDARWTASSRFPLKLGFEVVEGLDRRPAPQLRRPQHPLTDHPARQLRHFFCRTTRRCCAARPQPCRCA